MATALLTTCSALSNGQDGVAGVAQVSRFTFAGAWIENDKYTINCIFGITGVLERFGAGDLTGKVVKSLYTYKNKENLVAGSEWFFSQLADSTAFNNPDGTGNGNIKLANHVGISEELVGLRLYKNKMVVFSPNSTQIWDIDADPDKYFHVQTFESIGCSAPMSIRGLGVLDVLFLGNAGIHNIQAKDSTLDAGVIDIGTPVNQLISDAINAGADDTVACSIVEPRASRYWLYFDGVFYVLSYFAQAGIVSWSTFTPTYKTETLVASTSLITPTSLRLNGLTIGGVYRWVKGVDGHDIHDSAGNVLLSDSGYFVATETTAFVLVTNTIPVDPVYGEVYLVTSASFAVEKMVTYGNVIYLRATDNKIYAYGGSTGLQYDTTQAVLELPWLADKTPLTRKQFQSIDVAMLGHWTITGGADPQGGALVDVYDGGSLTAPNTNQDSTFDSLRIPFEVQGTHLKLRCSSSSSSNKMCRLSGIHVLYGTLDTN